MSRTGLQGWINTKDPGGSTPLHHAAGYGDLESVKLASHGEDYDRAIQNAGDLSDSISQAEQILRSGAGVGQK